MKLKHKIKRFYNDFSIKKFYNNYLFYIFSFVPVLFINELNDWGGDFALYIDQSLHLLNGNLNDLYDKQVFINEFAKWGPYFYPMGVSILISPVIYFFGVSFIHLKLFGILFWFGSLYFLKKYLETFFPENTNSIILTLLMTQFSFVYFQILDNVMSDVYFFFFFNLFLFLFSKLNNNKYIFYFIGFVLFYLNILRPSGIVITILFFTFLGYNFLKKRKIIYLIPLITFSIFYLIYNNLFSYDFGSNEINYIKENIGIISIIRNLEYYLILISKYLTGGLFIILKNTIFIKLFSVVLVSSILIYLILFYVKRYKLIKKTNSLILIIITISFIGFHILIPLNNGIRYLFPVLPLISFNLIKSFSKKTVLILILIQVFTVFSAIFIYKCNYYTWKSNTVELIKSNENLVFTVFSSTFYYKSNYYSWKSNSVELMKSYDFINKNLTNDTIVFKKPRVLNLFTNSISIPHNEKSIKDHKYILYVNGLSDDLDELYEGYFKIIYESENVKILENEK